MKENLAKIASAADNSLKVAALIAEGCNEAKGADLMALEMKGISDFADYFIVVSGRSDRQAQGIARRALEIAHASGIEPVSVEGFDRGHWILVDFGEVVLHVFYEPMREHYNLEALWTRAKHVNLAAAKGKTRSTKAVRKTVKKRVALQAA